MKIAVSTGNSRMDKKWNLTEMELEDFRERISKTQRTAETMEQYRKMKKSQQDDIKDVGGFVLGRLKGGRRKKDCVISRSALTLDMDYAVADIGDQLELFFSFQCYLYSTHKHTPEKPRLRLIIPLSHEISPDEYMAVSRKVAEEIGMELFDDTTYEPSRLMYWPSIRLLLCRGRKSAPFILKPENHPHRLLHRIHPLHSLWNQEALHHELSEYFRVLPQFLYFHYCYMRKK